MATDFGIILPLWAYGGAQDDLLERAVGEIGVTHVTVPVVTGPYTRYRVHAGGHSHYFHTEGGWHFPPRGELYRSHNLRPTAAEWFKRKNVLARFAEDANKRSLPWFARIAPRAATSWLADGPQLALVNEWGEAETGGTPCVLNPELAQLLHELVADVQGYGPAGLELDDWGLGNAGAHWSALRHWPDDQRALLELCFCPTCRQIGEAAGVDTEAAARSAQVELERRLSGPVTAPLDPLLDRYAAARAAESAAGLVRLGRHVPGVRFLGHGHNDSTAKAPEGWHALRILDRAPGADLAGAMRSQAGAISCPAGYPWFESADALFAALRGAVSAGVDFFDFAVDEAPEDALDWLRRAVRFLRRETAER